MKRTALKRKTPLRRAAFGLGRRSKFGNIRTEYGGRVYDSRKEADYARKLDLLATSAGPFRVQCWTPQVPVRMEVNGNLICTYIADFLVEFPDGHAEYHEVKGRETDTWKLKEKLFRALYPDRRLVVIR